MGRTLAFLTPQQDLALQILCDGQPMVAIAAQLRLRIRRHLWATYWRPALAAVTRACLAQRQAESPELGQDSPAIAL